MGGEAYSSANLVTHCLLQSVLTRRRRSGARRRGVAGTRGARAPTQPLDTTSHDWGGSYSLSHCRRRRARRALVRWATARAARRTDSWRWRGAGSTTHPCFPPGAVPAFASTPGGGTVRVGRRCAQTTDAATASDHLTITVYHLSKHAGIDMPTKGRGPSHQRKRRGGSRRSRRGRRSSGRGAGREGSGGDARGATGDIHPSEKGRLREHVSMISVSANAVTYHVVGGGVGSALAPQQRCDGRGSYLELQAMQGTHSRPHTSSGSEGQYSQKGMLGRGKKERKEGKGANVKGLISTTSH